MTRSLPSLLIRYRPPQDPLASFVWGSFLFHLIVAGALVVAPTLRRRPVVREDIWVVGLAALPGSPPGVAAAPAGRVAAGRDGVHLESNVPVPERKPAVKNKVKSKDKPPEPREKEPLPAGPSPVYGPQPPVGPSEGAGGIAPGGMGESIVAIDGGDTEFAWYRTSVIALLRSRWIRPVLEGTSQTLSVAVTFSVDPDGRVRDLRVETSSGVPSLDRSALRAVEDASPLPPLPSTWGRAPFSARFEFRWSPGGD